MNASTKMLMLASAAILSSHLFFASSAEAQTRERRATIQTDQGRNATRTTRNTFENGARTRSKSVQTGSGRGYDRTRTTGYDEDANALYRNRTVTTNSGQTATAGKEAACADGTCYRSRAFTGPQGAEAGSYRSRSVDDNGDYVKSRDVYGPNGQTASRDVVRDGEGGKTTTVTGPEGESRSRTRWLTVD
ncbi:hypothetical protein [Ponticaulis profundi]|uniref:Secreted protein n=1 Tax=Ponticaulis profundi TaxID=2665222 RepID=A0ABW1S8X4_9PROT